MLVLLSFGAVDLVFTRTFSASAAAEHVIHSPDPDWQRSLDDATREGEKTRQQLPPGVRAWTDGYWNRPTVATRPHHKIRADQEARLAHNFQRRIARGHEQSRKRPATHCHWARVERKNHRREALRDEALEDRDVSGRERQVRHL